jgi:hypothetical protein
VTRHSARNQFKSRRGEKHHARRMGDGRRAATYAAVFAEEHGARASRIAIDSSRALGECVIARSFDASRACASRAPREAEKKRRGASERVHA